MVEKFVKTNAHREKIKAIFMKEEVGFILNRWSSTQGSGMVNIDGGKSK